jgi:hypothetical protein
MRNVSEKKVVEKIKTHMLCSTFFSSENSAVYEMTRKNMVKPDRPQTTISYGAFLFQAG